MDSKLLYEIASFLNTGVGTIEQLPLDTQQRMEVAIKQDDYMTLHHVGYELINLTLTK